MARPEMGIPNWVSAASHRNTPSSPPLLSHILGANLPSLPLNNYHHLGNNPVHNWRHEDFEQLEDARLRLAMDIIN